jgi:DNA-directed RNA polymerase specialized sigma24 family protein
MVGDEAELFERYHKRLLKATAYNVQTTPDNVEEACAFAWATLMRREDVHRDTAFAWLKEVARHEAMRLHRRDHEYLPIGTEPGAVHPELIDIASGNPYVTPGALNDAMARLRLLPERLQRIVGLRSLGWRYADMASELGISQTRVSQLLVVADQHLNRLREGDLAARHPRTARLHELEEDPPAYLRAAIGRPPGPNNRKAGRPGLLRDWRRLALAIEDHRERHGITDAKHALGILAPSREERTDRELLRAQIDRFVEARGRYEGLYR